MLNAPTTILAGDAVRCLFTKTAMAPAELEENIRAGWPADQAPLLLNHLLTSDLVEPAPSRRGYYRLKSDVPEVDWHTLFYQASLPARKEEPQASYTDTKAPRFSLYRGGIKQVKPSGALTLGELYDELTSGCLRSQTERLRAVGRTSSAYSSLKNQLDYVTPGGQFTHRAESGLVARSGLIVLDFDKLPNLPDARAALLADPKLGPAVKLLFTSPSGDGLKCLLPTDPRFTHLQNFDGLSRYLSHKYAALGLIPDKACKDISRACYLAHDPDAYLHPEYQSSSKLAA